MGAFDDIIAAFGAGVSRTFQQMGMAINGPVAQTRITRTPVYTVPGEDWPATKGGEYDPTTGQIRVKDSTLQAAPEWILPHESAHAIFNQSDLRPRSVQIAQGMRLGRDAMDQLRTHPELYGRNLSPETLANEGLAFSVPFGSGAPFVEYVASQIKDPALADQLRRLNRNAVSTKMAQFTGVPPTDAEWNDVKKYSSYDSSYDDTPIGNFGAESILRELQRQPLMLPRQGSK